MSSRKSGTGWLSSGSGKRVSKKKAPESTPQSTPNKFQNDGSFMEKFKKMAEEQQAYVEQSDSTEASTITSATEKEVCVENDGLPATTFLAPQTISYKSSSEDKTASSKRPQQGIIGKRKNLLKTNELREKRKKRRGELEEKQSAELAEQKSSAWKSYMAEVKAYEARNCGDRDDHKRPLVK